ncbi:MerR family transcriptional regulator [Breznakia pachnodae]|uniref:DNA-binding transcriptional MerR regulator n=1 Tax=Breznakia pachnodae TaxID=265178 RepID=A0ABU0E5F3_9FIRM|nr:MerR family transcriptional regulator [Breznakia pachnodae]MDQ0362055.1 DNA-binding transcriptional MerR regulator [Breznakia pachnodae]
MELQTVSQVSKEYGVSTRMLRYYEQVGLLHSLRKEGYAYRVYDNDALTRLQQIIVLRKLRIPVKQIIRILNNSDAVQVVEIFRENIDQLDDEITALSTVKSILLRFVEEIREKTDVSLHLLSDDTLLSVIGSLSFSDNQIKKVKEEISMEELNKADQSLSKITDKDVRIIYLPPMTMAAVYASGEGCEGVTGDLINQFVVDNNLLDIKPDLRSFGFDCPIEEPEIGRKSHRYEMWVSVPDDMEIPKPFVRREFKGGLYAAHVLRSWDFQDWRLLGDWVKESDKYDNDWGSSRWQSKETLFGQGLEETLNFYNYARKGFPMQEMQLDLLFPIKEK